MTLNDIRKGVMELPEDQRAILAGELLESLPGVLFDEDGGVSEAARRSAELDENPDAARSWEEIKAGLGR